MIPFSCKSGTYPLGFIDLQIFIIIIICHFLLFPYNSWIDCIAEYKEFVLSTERVQLGKIRKEMKT